MCRPTIVTDSRMAGGDHFTSKDVVQNLTAGCIGGWGRLIYVQIVVSFPDMFHNKSHLFISSSNSKRLMILIVMKY